MNPDASGIFMTHPVCSIPHALVWFKYRKAYKMFMSFLFTRKNIAESSAK